MISSQLVWRHAEECLHTFWVVLDRGQPRTLSETLSGVEKPSLSGGDQTDNEGSRKYFFDGIRLSSSML